MSTANLRIFKYPIQTIDSFTIEMPEGAQFLTVQMQDGRPYLWATVNIGLPATPHVFHVVGTGIPMPTVPVLYVGTWQEPPFVWHLLYSLYK